MSEKFIKNIIKNIQNGDINEEQAVEKIQNILFEDTGFAKIDHHRVLRTGFPETIFCENKTADEIIKILEILKTKGSNILATRLNSQKADSIMKTFPEGTYHERARTFTIKLNPYKTENKSEKILIIAAGTSDLPAAEEAAITAEMMGEPCLKAYDVGVAGIQRLFAQKEKFQKAKIVIAAAGMEGALPGVAAGIFGKPVIGLPTSVGYGTAFNGLSALLTMLNSCASGVSVVNIDNGYGAAYTAVQMIRSLSSE